MEHSPEIVRIDLNLPAHREALVVLLDEYARGETGGGKPLDPAAKAALPDVLAARPHYLGWLAFVGGEPAGLANCFETVSTFRARPLLNVHDLVVSARFRRLGLGASLLAAVERAARERGCCKLTLEVLSGNAGAIALYRRVGFDPYELDPAMGAAMFFEKWLA